MTKITDALDELKVKQEQLEHKLAKVINREVGLFQDEIGVPIAGIYIDQVSVPEVGKRFPTYFVLKVHCSLAI